jgi:hypothetical protein
MPALKDMRQERFCLLVHKGVVPFKAYPMAGYRPDFANPYRLTENDGVKRRLAELSAPVARKARVSAESLLEELEAGRMLAFAKGNAAAAVAATMAKAKLAGLLINRTETGEPRSFEVLDRDVILAKIRERHGDDVCSLLAQALDK